MADRKAPGKTPQWVDPESEAWNTLPWRKFEQIEAIFNGIRRKPKFVFDADIKGCFDNIDQKALLQKLQTYSAMRQTAKGWLKAGVITPLLANIALHGVEEVTKKRSGTMVRGHRTPSEPQENKTYPHTDPSGWSSRI